MKHRLLIKNGFLALLLTAVLMAMVSPLQRDVFKSVENAFTLGDAAQMEIMLSSSVELELPGEEEGIYSKAQTLAILNRFFERFPPNSFKVRHSGHSASGARFAVGDYLAESERTFRVTIFAKKQGSNYLIQEIEFE